MLVHPQIDPVAIKLGPLAVHWYGLMYMVGFLAFLLLGRARLRQLAHLNWTTRDLDDLMFAGAIGVILGGRLGYVLFYKPSAYLADPMAILRLWEGGMSFHGGMLGVFAATLWFAWKRGVTWLTVTDFIAPTIPIGLAAGRLGNFINGELWGRPANPDLPWAMIFPQVDQIPRHPSQLYQMFGEGILLFFVLWIYARKPRPTGAVSSLFLIGYGTARFLAEFAREPDNFLGYLALNLSMGQWLSLPMIVIGLWMWKMSHRERPLLPAR